MPTVLKFHFNFDRSLQAAAHLLCKFPEFETDYLRLLKMLYIADREFLAEYGYPITGDKVLAMQYGPVLIHTFNLLKGDETEDRVETWREHIVKSHKHFVMCIKNPGDGDLSKASVAKLDEVFERYGHLPSFQIVRMTHEFTEWQESFKFGMISTIPWWAILRAQGKSDMSVAVQEQIRLQAHADALAEACG